MRQQLRSLGAVGVASFASLFAFGPVQSALASTTPTTTCPSQALVQPFAGDSNWYTLTPGEAPDNVTGTGWTLTGGAKLVATKLADGTTGSVLDLPAGSTAETPAMCIDSAYPLARMETRTLGKSPDSSARFYTQVVGTSTLSLGMPVLGTPSWGVSAPDNLAPTTGAEQVQFKFVAGAKAADLQVYNLYIDPKMVT